MKLLTQENIIKNQVDTIEQFKVLDYLKKQLSIDDFTVYLIDRFTIKVIDKNKEQGYFKYYTKTKSVDFYEKNIKNKEVERWKNGIKLYISWRLFITKFNNGKTKQWKN